jgi:iron-sulfur cluster repair protein YtfE (RIC family)
MSTTVQQQKQVDLPGQTYVAEGPNDHTGMYVMHHGFRRDLARFASAVRNTPASDTETWRLLGERYRRFAVTLHHHHTAEDDIYWPVLRRAAAERGTPEDLAAVSENSDEHAEMDPCLDLCAQGFADMASHPCEDHRNALDLRLAGLAELLLAHMEHEEHEILPLVQRVMENDEFVATEKALTKTYPTKEIPFLVPWALHGLPVEARDRMFALAGAPYRILHALTRRGFERRETRAFRYADRP